MGRKLQILDRNDERLKMQTVLHANVDLNEHIVTI